MRYRVNRARNGSPRHLHPKTVLKLIEDEPTNAWSKYTRQSVIDVLTYAAEKRLFPREPHTEEAKATIRRATKEAMAALRAAS
jgi:hypothetical protein